jgi:hypothetical protein
MKCASEMRLGVQSRYMLAYTQLRVELLELLAGLTQHNCTLRKLLYPLFFNLLKPSGKFTYHQV